MEIKVGDRGYEVVDIQQRLAALSYDLGPTGVDGLFGKCTKAAVKAFQKDRDLAETGVVDEDTWRQVVYATYRFGSRALYLRTPFFRGDDVRQLQFWLNSIGFRTDYIDGIFGPSTEHAVREFQENVGLIADGIIGPATLAALHNLRSILNVSEESVFPDILLPDSVVSSLQDRKIAIGCPTPRKHDWLAPTGNQQLICADLAHRFSNLLEILGAQVEFFRLGANSKDDNEFAILFEPGGRDIKPDSFDLSYNQKYGECKTLVRYIATALNSTLEDEIKEITISEDLNLDGPGAGVVLGDFTLLSSGANLKKDVFKQKIAGAILDGLNQFIAN